MSSKANLKKVIDRLFIVHLLYTLLILLKIIWKQMKTTKANDK